VNINTAMGLPGEAVLVTPPNPADLQHVVDAGRTDAARRRVKAGSSEPTEWALCGFSIDWTYVYDPTAPMCPRCEEMDG
jgi:hypothetical protein